MEASTQFQIQIVAALPAIKTSPRSTGPRRNHRAVRSMGRRGSLGDARRGTDCQPLAPPDRCTG